MRIADLPTPSLLLDRRRLAANLTAMRGRTVAAGVRLRPHLKTAKSAAVARLALGAAAGPIAVSTLAEAEYFAGHGFTDITLAVGIVPGKLDRAAALLGRGVRLGLLTDDPSTARAIAARGQALGVTFPVHVEIDSGGSRAGLPPGDPTLVEVARILARGPGSSHAGVLTHAGQSYRRRGATAHAEVAATERDSVVAAATLLRAAGLPCPVVNAGSTPTATFGRDWSGVDELRLGLYMFMDLDQHALGVCGVDDIALSVLASVIGHNRRAAHLLLDAGAIALSKDLSADEFRPGTGYSLVCDAAGGAPLPGLAVASVAQEHGIVPLADPALFDRLPVGARVRVLPVHACLTAAAWDHYVVVEAGEPVDRWDRCAGW
ncbi:MAG: DSD1 family PLP-dependent enzyme [Alphaproteobacteria bacterium]|nr:DSD1 family PLP-dependent enzyme [Alphaproteobacteria bacterium]